MYDKSSKDGSMQLICKCSWILEGSQNHEDLSRVPVRVPVRDPLRFPLRGYKWFRGLGFPES